VGRFSVEFEVANHEDVVQAKKGFLPPEQVRRGWISGVVDTGAARLVLPASVVAALGLPEAGQVTVNFADGRGSPSRLSVTSKWRSKAAPVSSPRSSNRDALTL
jgi:predicted aspartyl protease